MKNRVASKTISFNYSFPRDGGAVGSIQTGAFLPKNVLIKKVYFQGLTNLTSGGSATLEVQISGGAVLQPASGFAVFPDAGLASSVNDIAGTVSGSSAVSETEMSVNTVAGQVELTIAAAALTAGAFNCFIDYVEIYDTTVI